MEIVYVKTENIKPADWRVTHILKPDLKTLAESILRDGWIAPILVRQEDSVIIDGFSRWVVAQSHKGVIARDGKKIPVLWVDCDETDARLMHVRINRAKGMTVPWYLSLTVKDILESGKYDEKQIRTALNIKTEEWDLLMAGNLFKQRKIAEHEYSKAWVPIESNGRDIPTFERPPTPDG